ncbi:MAG: erythromycin esterase family protein [Vicingaceae bacterium]|nr:erythromycin esterase family protein [Vicingaceae bacterium]
MFLKEVLAGVEIVGLGEQSHSDGPTFEAKVRLIKFLHEDLGFNVIAFESGLYDCSKANELIKNRTIENDTNYLNRAIFGVWNCRELHQLAKYIDETQKTPNPLHLTGFDCQFAGLTSRDYFIQDVNDFLLYIENRSNQKLNIDTARLNNSLKELAKYSNFFKKLSPEDTLFLSNTIDTLLSVINTHNIVDEQISFWKQVFKSVKVDYRKKYVYKTSPVLRDSMMAENLKWIVNEQYKNQKVILWSANTHLANSTKSVDSKYLSKNKLMGNYLKDEFSDKYYFMAFTSYGGDVTGLWLIDFIIKLRKKNKNSVEQFLYNIGYDYSFMDLRKQISENNPYFYNSRIFGHNPDDMNLYKVVDGLFYIKEMYPATYKY